MLIEFLCTKGDRFSHKINLSDADYATLTERVHNRVSLSLTDAQAFNGHHNAMNAVGRPDHRSYPSGDFRFCARLEESTMNQIDAVPSGVIIYDGE